MSTLTLTPRSLTTTPSHLEISFGITNPASAANAVSAGNSIAPATYLQLSFDFGNDLVVFPDTAVFTPRDVAPAQGRGEGEGVISMLRKDVPKSGTPNPEVKIYAWKGEKMLGSWAAGRLVQ